MKLEDRLALVTGAGRGIGRSIALALATEGADVVINDIDGSLAEAVANEVRALGREALAVAADVTSSAQVNTMVTQSVDRFGKIDILVNNAGYSVIKPFVETDEEEWRRMIGLNLIGVMTCCKAVLTEMIPRGSGRIINISSDAGRMGAGGQATYSAAKGGVLAFTKALAQEMARYQINVNTVAPGGVDTDLTRGMSVQHPHFFEEVVKRVPLRRIGRPEDIAGAVVFLATDDAGYLTGQTISVNGGMMMF